MKRFILLGISLILIMALLAGCANEKPEKSKDLLFNATFTLTDQDENGKVLSSKTYKSESYVIAFIDLLYARMRYGTAYLYDISNTYRSFSPAAYDYSVACGAGSATYGIQIGTGTNAVSMADYCLQTKINEGTSSGTLSYSAVTFGAPSTSGSTRSFNIIRTFSNGSSASITANEIGLVGMGSTTPNYFLFIRDLIPGGQTIAVGHALTVSYTISISL